MSIGMKRGSVYLEEHQIEWESAAEDTIQIIKSLLNETAVDVQHIGSTSIKRIPAKPIIDIAVGVKDFDAVLLKKGNLEKAEIIFRLDERPEQLLFVKGDFEKDTRTHHIHVVLYGSKEWNDYINFRDYLNTNEEKSDEYARLKLKLSLMYPTDRALYTEGKSELISNILSEALQWKLKNATINSIK